MKGDLAISLRKILPPALKKKLPKEIGVVKVARRKSRRFNRQYRGKDRATNVLSFRYGPAYGEIIVCPEVVRDEAKIGKKSFEYQMTWMVLHGMIHLAGLHHEKSAGTEKRVERLEQRILDRLFAKK